jgi:hypothetical protein
MPFPVDDTKLKALRMDMRDLDFPDGTFDCCYSTCAVEHIGTRGDFLRHFNEVARVLKNDGVYVFTTEILYGQETIRDSHNHVFSLHDLYEIFAESDLAPQEEFDARVTQHKINFPAPSNVKSLSHFVPELFTERLLQEAPHIQLMRGKHPFTCGLFVMRKKAGAGTPGVPRFIGLESSREFMESGLQVYRELLQRSSVSINPFSLLPGETSRFFADHAEFFTHKDPKTLDPETVFHSDYFWFGSGQRVFDVVFTPADLMQNDGSEIELRIHRFKTLASRDVECVVSSVVRIEEARPHPWRFEVDIDEEYSYAILGKARRGNCLCKSIDIKSYPHHLAPARGTAPTSITELQSA